MFNLKNVRDLGLNKGVIVETRKGVDNLLKLFKRFLKVLNVPFYDECCPTDLSTPLPVGYTEGEGIVRYNPENKLFETISEGLLKEFKLGSVGQRVSFIKPSGSDPETSKDVIIPGELEITRGNGGGGIYNITLESTFNTGVSPENTTWNTQYVDDANTSWAPLWDIQNRTYITWRNAGDGVDDYVIPQYVGMPAVMKWDNGDDNPRYWLIMFTEWGVGDYNEYGFAYDRWEILPQVYFEKENYDDDAVDIISNGVHIKRDNQRGLYNAVTDPDAEQGASPRNTKWNSSYIDSRTGYSGWDDLSNLESRVYTSFVDALDGNVGDNIPGTDLVMWDMTTDLYYKINFESWTQGEGGGGGGFAYYRTVIPQSNGITFADGTVLNTASTGGGGSTGSGPITIQNTNSLFSTGFTGTGTDSTAEGSNFFGENAGFGATSANNSNFLGVNAGNGAADAASSNFFGNGAGMNAIGTSNSNFFGDQAGIFATNVANSNFLGASAGANASGTSNSNFFGLLAGNSSSGNNVNAFGTNAGTSNALNGQTIFSNASMPSFADHTDAEIAISIPAGGSPGSTYLYHNQATNSIGAVRL